MPPLPRWFRLVLLSLTILGGLNGIGLTLWLASTVHSPLLLALVGCMFAAYAFVTTVGVLFWLRPEKLEPVLIQSVLALQLPWISNSVFVYKFASGMYLVVSVVITGGQLTGGFNFFIGSSCEVRFLQESPLSLGVNLVPLFALILLAKYSRVTPSVPNSPATISDVQGATNPAEGL
jgi:hypothetical protein